MNTELQHQVTTITDKGGDTLTYLRHKNGLLTHTGFTTLDLDGIHNLDLRADDIIFCSYPRTGCHWFWEQVRMVQAGSTDIPVLEKRTSMLEQNPVDHLATLASPRIFSTHLDFDLLPRQMKEGSTKLVMVYRHPKDVAVSFFHILRQGPWWNYSGQFRNWLPLFLEGTVDFGSYADYLNNWSEGLERHPHIPVHISTFEGLKHNPIDELDRLSRFLGKENDVSLLQSIVDACAIDKLRERKAHMWEGQGIPNAPYLMYREGKTGGWKDFFTVAMDELFHLRWSQTFRKSRFFKIE